MPCEDTNKITQQGLHFWFTRLAVHSWCWALFWRHSLMLPTDGFYTSPTFSCFRNHWNKIFRVIDEYIMRTMKSYCGVIVDALSTRTPFSGIICDDHIWCQRGHIFSIEMVTPLRGIGNLFNGNKISMIKAKIPSMYTYYLAILKNIAHIIASDEQNQWGYFVVNAHRNK